MDPIANLQEQRELSAEINAIFDDADPIDGSFTLSQMVDLSDKAVRLAELVQALDEWRTKGGFDPYLAE